MSIDPNHHQAIAQTLALIQGGHTTATHDEFWELAKALKTRPIPDDVFTIYLQLHHTELGEEGEDIWTACERIFDFLEWNDDPPSVDPTDL